MNRPRIPRRGAAVLALACVRRLGCASHPGLADGALAETARRAFARVRLPARAELDLMGWDETDIFAHS